MKKITGLALAAAAMLQAASSATRLKEVVSYEGVRDNQLIGYGIVVGLAGTGDKRQSVFPAQSLANMLERMGVQINPSQILVRNTAAVMVTATLPAFAQPGTRIDVTVGAMGDAANLQGGLLITTPLSAANGQVFAVAQGAVVTGGFIAGRGGNSQTLNHPTVGRIPGGAIVERAPPSVTPGRVMRLQLRQADFTTAMRVAEAINRKFAGTGDPVAKAENPALVEVTAPAGFAARPVEFLAAVEALTIEADRPARIVINERTGTIVMGKEVKISPVAIMHGTLSVEIQTTFDVSQPAPFSDGKTQVVPQVGVGVKEEKSRNLVLKEGASVEELVRALQSIGTTPRDVIAILQNLKAAGALEADLEVI
ncbi:MAG: flagellar basal body P-ring protein FlgI [Acidobacteria bacterium]|nr:flagellar basal body P-ring protein FlgI [Acidobacteriota bacterium]